VDLNHEPLYREMDQLVLDLVLDASEGSVMRKVLTESGNRDFMVKVFPNAGHSLGEIPSGANGSGSLLDTSVLVAIACPLSLSQ
jgi:hypothetical protein